MTKGAKSNAIQYLYGETNEVEIPVVSVKTNECNEIAVGDPIVMHLYKTTSGHEFKAIPIGELADASVGDASAKFAGISMSESKDGDSDDIRVATTGVFEFPLAAAATIKPGYVAKVTTGAGASSGSIDVDSATAAAPDGTYRAIFGQIVNDGTSQSVAKVKIATKVFQYASIGEMNVV